MKKATIGTNLNNKSKRLAYLLRHDKEYKFDISGWRKVSDLIENHGFVLEELNEIIEDIGSGINYNKPGLLKLIEKKEQGLKQ